MPQYQVCRSSLPSGFGACSLLGIGCVGNRLGVLMRSSESQVKTVCCRPPAWFSVARSYGCLVTLLTVTSLVAVAQESRPSTQHAGLPEIQTYIANAWDTLTRSPNDCKTVIDGRNPNNSILYF